MSEFTSGLLFLRTNRTLVQDMASDQIGMVFDYFIHDVNEKWSVVLLEDFGTQLSNHRVQRWLREMSQQFPILYFSYADDHGWSFRLIYKESTLSSIDIAYEIDWFLAYEYLESKYPHFVGDPGKLFDTEDILSLYEKIRQTERYTKAVEDMYQKYDAEKFSVFDVSEEQINLLKNEISADVFKKSLESMRHQVNVFLEVLQLEEVSWMSYRYLKKRQDEDE